MSVSNSTGTVNTTVSDSVVARNDYSFLASSGSAVAPVMLSVFHSTSANNGYGYYVTGTGAILCAAQSMVTENTHGWFIGSGCVIASYGENYIDGNRANTGSLTPISRK